MRDRHVPYRTGCIIADRLLVLDRRASRYFAVPYVAGVSAHLAEPPEQKSAILSWADDRLPSCENARATWVQRARVGIIPDSNASNPAALFRLWRAERAVAHCLQSGISGGLDMLSAITRDKDDARAQAALVAASWRSRRLWSAEDRCLPRSIALAGLLRKVGSSAKLVLGVMSQPFSAHAWVQDGNVVLNDTLDHVTLFTPILIA